MIILAELGKGGKPGRTGRGARTRLKHVGTRLPSDSASASTSAKAEVDFACKIGSQQVLAASRAGIGLGVMGLRVYGEISAVGLRARIQRAIDCDVRIGANTRKADHYWP